MKIYQLHEHSGEWEDYRDRIIGSYLRKERAEEEKTKAEAREKEAMEQSKKCNRCPFLEDAFSPNIDHLLGKHPNYCDKVQLSAGDYGIDCDNFYLHWNDADFEIQEVEVEE